MAGMAVRQDVGMVLKKTPLRRGFLCLSKTVEHGRTGCRDLDEPGAGKGCDKLKAFGSACQGLIQIVTAHLHRRPTGRPGW